MVEGSAYTASIGQILIDRQAVVAEELVAATEEARTQGQLLEKYLVNQGLVEPDDMTLAISQYLRIPPIRLARLIPNEQVLELIDRAVLAKHLAFPVARVGKVLTIALGDPFDMFAVEDLQSITGLEVTPLVAAERDIIEALEKFFPDEAGELSMEELLKDADAELEIGHESSDDEGDESLEHMLESAEGAPVIRMVNMMLLEAMRTGASDIHFEPQEKNVRLRYRLDGALVESPSPPKNLQAAIISRMKLMSGMDLAEKRVPQDGRIKIRAMNREVDLRVNTLPTVFGEKIVMRILDKSALFPNLQALGLDEAAYKAMKHGITQPHGIIYVTGPTGSGKTTTLYSCLLEMNKPEVNIVTAEDPVEYQLDGINQVQINAYVGLSFATALRSVLRQSPDIILVGETRDSETAEIAIKAALTGHLVFSTLHTNDAPGAITRLIDMGVEPSLISASLILAQAQRLIRRLCSGCKKQAKELPIDKLTAYGLDPADFEGDKIFEKVGCRVCHNTGYKGRQAVMEVLNIDAELRRDIVQGLSSNEIAVKARAKGMVTLKDIGIQKVKEGLTSFDAALQVTGGGE